MDVTEETIVTVLVKKRPHEKLPHSSTLELYNKTPIFIPVGITEGVVKPVARKKCDFGPQWHRLGSSKVVAFKIQGGQQNTSY